MDTFEKVSEMVRMVLYKLEVGNLTMKSMAIDVNGKVKDSDGMG